MKKILSVLLMTGVLFTSAAYAERMFIKAGTTRSYTSPNGRYTVKATAQTEGGDVWALSLLEKDKEISRLAFQNDPDVAAVSDNGAVIAVLNPSSQSEVGSESVSIYDDQWKLVRTIPFADLSHKDQIPLKMAKVLTLSPDGSSCALGEAGGEGAGISLYDLTAGALVWEKPLGFPEIREIVFSPDGKYLLTATYERENFDMLIQFLDRAGNVLWEKRILKNFSSYEVQYVRFQEDGKSIEVFDTKKGAYLTESLPV